MADPTYSAIAFLETNTDFNIDAASDCLTAHAASAGGHITKVSDKELHMYLGDFCLKIAVWDEPGTLEENQQLYPPDSTHPKILIASQCLRRVHVWSNDADPDMAHFNDYLISMETLCDSFRGFHAQDDGSGDWFD